MPTTGTPVPGSRPRPRRRSSALLPLLLISTIASLGPGTRPKAARAAPEPAWRISLGDSAVDTVLATPGAARAAAIASLEADGWRFARVDSTAGRLVTEWKPLRHPLLRLLAGEARARCVIDLVAVDSAHTRVVFRGGVATREDLTGTAVLGAARLAYGAAARGWFGELRGELEARERAARVTTSSAASGGGSPLGSPLGSPTGGSAAAGAATAAAHGSGGGLGH